MKKVAIIFGVFLGCIYLVFEYNQYTKYLGMLPEEIDVSYFFTFGTRDFGACGAAIFALNDETYNSIVKDGLSFLNKATKTRRLYKNNYVNQPLAQDTYGPWRKTDQFEQKFWLSDAAFSGLYCYGARQVSNKVREIRKNIIEFGAYYTRIKYNVRHAKFYGSRLLIVPSMKIAVIEYWGY